MSRPAAQQQQQVIAQQQERQGWIDFFSIVLAGTLVLVVFSSSIVTIQQHPQQTKTTTEECQGILPSSWWSPVSPASALVVRSRTTVTSRHGDSRRMIQQQKTQQQKQNNCEEAITRFRRTRTFLISKQEFSSANGCTTTSTRRSRIMLRPLSSYNYNSQEHDLFDPEEVDNNDSDDEAVLAVEQQQQEERRKERNKKQKSEQFLYRRPVTNEFSRTLDPARILRRRRTNDNIRGYYGNDYIVDIAANEDECKALANRFDLSDIEKLESSLQLRPEPSVGGRSGSSGGGIEVEGKVCARLTQTCVRTNDQFPMDVAFDLYCIVRPVKPIMLSSAMGTKATGDDDEEDDDGSAGTARGISSGKRGYRRQLTNDRVAAVASTSKNIKNSDLIQLQQMLEEEIRLNGNLYGNNNSNDGNSNDINKMNNHDYDILMEDEFIYPINGLLDIGELVSQLFYLKLDPYPKKPGTKPVKYTFSG